MRYLIIIITLFTVSTAMTAQVKLQQMERSAVKYDLPVAKRTIGVTPGYFQTYMTLPDLIDSLGITLGTLDSIYLSNDTIYLRDGAGFVKLPAGGGGGVDSIYLQNDTIFLRDGSGFVDLSGVQTTPDSIYIANDTIRLRDGSGFVDASAFGGGGGGTVTSVGLDTGTTGTDVNVTGSPITTSGTFTLNIPTASATNTGKLSNTDWTTFNNKVGGSGANTQVAYFNSSNTLTSDNSFLRTPNILQLINSRILLQGAGSAWNIFINGGNTTLTGGSNVGIGSNLTLQSLTSGSSNFALGATAGRFTSTGSNNFYAGTGAGYSNVSSSDNAFIGSQAGYLATGGSNCFVGPSAGHSSTTSVGTVNIGAFSGYLANNNLNVNLGYYTAFSASNNGRDNTNIGAQASRNGGGNRNVKIGKDSGINATGSDCVMIGAFCGSSETNSHRLYIENSSITTPLIGGHFDNNRIGINTEINSIARTLHVTGEARITDLITDPPTFLVGADNDGDLSRITLGSNLTLDGSTLNAAGGSSPQTWADLGSDVVNWGATGSSNSGKYIGIGTLSPLSVFHVNGNSTLAGVIYNSGNAAGTSGQVLTSQGPSSPWVWSNNDASTTNELNTSVSVVHSAGNVLPRVRVTDSGGTLEGLVPFFSQSNLNAGVVPGTNGASNTNFLRADGQWAVPAGIQYTAGFGIDITANTITNTGDLSTINELQNLSYGTKSGTDVPFNISSGTGITLRDGIGTKVNRVSASVVKIDNEFGYGQLESASNTLSLTTTRQKVAVGGTLDGGEVTVDDANDRMTVAETSAYKVYFRADCYSTGSAFDVTFEVLKNGTSLIGCNSRINMDGGFNSISAEEIEVLSANDYIELYAKGSTTSGTIECQNVKFNIQKITY